MLDDPNIAPLSPTKNNDEKKETKPAKITLKIKFPQRNYHHLRRHLRCIDAVFLDEPAIEFYNEKDLFSNAPNSRIKVAEQKADLSLTGLFSAPVEGPVIRAVSSYRSNMRAIEIPNYSPGFVNQCCLTWLSLLQSIVDPTVSLAELEMNIHRKQTVRGADCYMVLPTTMLELKSVRSIFWLPFNGAPEIETIFFVFQLLGKIKDSVKVGKPQCQQLYRVLELAAAKYPSNVRQEQEFIDAFGDHRYHKCFEHLSENELNIIWEKCFVSCLSTLSCCNYLVVVTHALVTGSRY